MAVREAIALAAIAAAALAPGAAAGDVERFAVVIGNDAGRPPDLLLRYAERDAARVAAVLQEVGGVRPENLVLLRGQDAGAVRRSLIAVNDRVRAAGRDTVLVVYYSGHADAGALHLGASALELAELEQLVRGSAAAFRLLVVDACRSGALTRVKGGTPIPPFDIRIAERLAGEGAVFLTSSSASEDSQESDELKGSFFTHALVSGLLGAADENGDGRVTLEEAYRYAYDATLRASSRTLAGLQHPTFQYELRGQGDLVLATLAPRSPDRAWLEFPAGRTWLLLISSRDGAVVGEVGAADRARRLSVRAGRYFVLGRGPDVLLEGPLEAPAGGAVAVDESRLARTAYARLVRKGEGMASAVASVEIASRVRGALLNERGPCPGVAAGVPIALHSLTVTPRLGWCRSGFRQPGLSATADAFDVELTAAHVWDLRALSIEVGLTVGGAVFHQAFRTAGSAPPRTTAALQLSPTAGVTHDIGARGYAFASVQAATYLFRSRSTATGRESFGPSFAPSVAVGGGFRL
ncbi:MAG TPA: caspase family protein [Anaeromyxobacter sp.]|nr:caspase family protein [Anaeromyxobacter sp.]